MILLLVLIVILHSLALYFFLYWRIWWFDNVLHFLGGAWLASALFYWAYFLRKIKENAVPALFVLVALVGFSAIGGILGEICEFFYDHLLGRNIGMALQLGVADTVTDLFFDLLGGLAAGLVFIKMLSKNGKQN